jgi:ferredoxin
MEDRPVRTRAEGAAGGVVTARWRLAVDPDRCIGSGLCVAMAPDRFRLADGRSRPVEPEVEEAEEILDAALSCPTEAITVRDTGTGEVLAPEEFD